MPNIGPDDLGFWILLLPGFVMVWCFRRFTGSKKTGDFEFLGLGIVCGLFNFLFYGLLMELGISKNLPLTKLGEVYGAALVLLTWSFLLGFFCAKISQWPVFRRFMKFLKSDWSKIKIF